MRSRVKAPGRSSEDLLAPRSWRHIGKLIEDRILNHFQYVLSESGTTPTWLDSRWRGSLRFLCRAVRWIKVRGGTDTDVPPWLMSRGARASAAQGIHRFCIIATLFNVILCLFYNGWEPVLLVCRHFLYFSPVSKCWFVLVPSCSMACTYLPVVKFKAGRYNPLIQLSEFFKTHFATGRHCQLILQTRCNRSTHDKLFISFPRVPL